MSFEEFKNAIIDYANKQYPNTDYRVNVQDIIKNNITLTGLSITRNSSDVGPVVYIENLYTQYISQNKTLENFYNDFSDMINNYIENIPFDIQDILNIVNDFNKAKNRLSIKLLNHDTNKPMTDSRPHIAFNDLDIFFKIDIDDETSIPVSNEIFKSWNISLDELKETALRNAELTHPINISSIYDVLESILTDTEPNNKYIESFKSHFPVQEPEMFVCSNKQELFGAATMAYPSFINALSEKIGKDAFIIPSSVHELIIIPVDRNLNADMIKSVVQEVNDTQIAPDEILSYNVYYFDNVTKQISIINNTLELEESNNKDDFNDLD